MPATRTKQLARKLGLVQSKKRKREEAGEESHKRKRNGQLLSYLVVIDFESTCWENKKGFQEIIEFPAVLLDIQTGKIVDEFQQYVLPRDNPKLSDFCKTLTGISQDQVDNGIPLATCLILFGRWIRKLAEERSIVLMEPGREYSEEVPLCALATWSDWDLEVCLNYECRRKQIRKPSYFNQWIDIRATYKRFYDQKPAGLNGALEDLGIKFTGRQHSGIDDARNTAKLCYRMIRDGYRLDITKCIQNKAKPSVVQPPSSIAKESSSNPSTKPAQLPKEHSISGKVDSCQIIEPNQSVKCTSTSETTLPMQSTAATVCNKESLKEPHNGRHSNIITECQLLCEGVENNSEEYRWTEELMKDLDKELDDWDDSITSKHIDNNESKDVELHQDSNIAHASSRGINSGAVVTTSESDQEKVVVMGVTPSRAEFISHITPVTSLTYSTKKNEKPQPSLFPSPKMHVPSSEKQAMVMMSGGSASEVFVVKETPPLHVKTCQTEQDQLQKKAEQQQCLHTHSKCKQTPSHNHVNSASPSVNHTPGTLQSGPVGNLSATASDGYKTLTCALSFRTPSSSEWMKMKRLSSSSTCTTPNDSSCSLVFLSGGKVTPPLCNCGKRTKRRTVSNPGPNEGKSFYACPNGKASDKSRGCGFFKWEAKLNSTPQQFLDSRSSSNTCYSSSLESEYVESER